MVLNLYVCAMRMYANRKMNAIATVQKRESRIFSHAALKLKLSREGIAIVSSACGLAVRQKQ